MDKIELTKRKNRLFIVASARGVNRFFVTNKFIEKFEKATAINTGAFIFNLTKHLGLNNFDSLTFQEYFKIIEPIMVQSICNHLQHEHVILDTHFHYLTPALSLNSLFKLKDYVSEVILVLVEENVLNIFKKNESSPDPWFKNIQNIDSDLKSNKHYLNFYEEVFKEFTNTKKITFNLSSDSINDIDTFLEEIK